MKTRASLSASPGSCHVGPNLSHRSTEWSQCDLSSCKPSTWLTRGPKRLICAVDRQRARGPGSCQQQSSRVRRPQGTWGATCWRAVRMAVSWAKHPPRGWVWGHGLVVRPALPTLHQCGVCRLRVRHGTGHATLSTEKSEDALGLVHLDGWLSSGELAAGGSARLCSGSVLYRRRFKLKLIGLSVCWPRLTQSDPVHVVSVAAGTWKIRPPQAGPASQHPSCSSPTRPSRVRCPGRGDIRQAWPGQLPEPTGQVAPRHPAPSLGA